LKFICLKSVTRKPPGSPVNPVLFVAPAFGANQRELPVSFKAAPAFEIPPKQLLRVRYSSCDGICQPSGASPLGSFTACQLYSFP